MFLFCLIFTFLNYMTWLISNCIHYLLIAKIALWKIIAEVFVSIVFLLPCRWWNMSMLKAWHSATLSLWTRTVLCVVLCGIQTMSPSCLIPTTGLVSTSVLKLAKSTAASIKVDLCFFHLNFHYLKSYDFGVSMHLHQSAFKSFVKIRLEGNT